MDKKAEILQATLNDNIGLATIIENGSVVELLTIGSQKSFEGKEYIENFYDCIDKGLLKHKEGQSYRITSNGKEYLKNITK